MTGDPMRVFFYGLFMDEDLLASKGVRPEQSEVGYLEGYRLHIGKRATLLPATGERAWGVVMTIAPEDATTLYSDPGVADYVAEAVEVTLPGTGRVPAVCYNLPASGLTGTNPDYAADLLALATRLGLPDSYLEYIRNTVDASQPR